MKSEITDFTWYFELYFEVITLVDSKIYQPPQSITSIHKAL